MQFVQARQVLHNAKCQRKTIGRSMKNRMQMSCLPSYVMRRLFKDPTAYKEDCQICFLPMPKQLICCVTLPPAAISSAPIHDFASAIKEFWQVRRYGIEGACTILSISLETIQASFLQHLGVTPKTNEEHLEQIMKRVEVNDPIAIFLCWLNIIIMEN
jgi:hypothetical protein